MKSFIFARSRGGRPIPGHLFGNQGPHILLLGGVHGDEREGVALAQEVWALYQGIFPYKLQLMLIPALNVDGVLGGMRQNEAGVDLNRNLPTRDWSAEAASPRYCPGPSAGSEPENQALVAAIEDFRPKFIISLHSFKRWMINVNGDCAPEAQLISSITGHPVCSDIGYPTPGSLGTYAGYERGIPTITYELRKGHPLPTLLPLHLKAVDRCLQLMQHTRAG